MKKEKKMKARKFRITGMDSHGFDIGTIVTFNYDDGTDMPSVIGIDRFGDYDDYFVRYSDMEEITDANSSPIHRLYTAIIGALFGPESHSRNRY